MEDDNQLQDINWVSNLNIAQTHNQLIMVLATGEKAIISMHNKDINGNWEELFSTSGYVGKNGIGKAKEGDMKTPTGVYKFTSAFGIKENPGTVFDYIQVDDSYYWVDDSNSKYYNKFVSTSNIQKDWTSAENIISTGKAYNYVLALNYNEQCVPGAGSAIFLHCSTGNSTAGCISVSENYMKEILNNIRKDCVIVIDSEDNILGY